MQTIYEPTGRAREYAPLACNIYSGCTHGCRYCYVPSVLRRTPEDFHSEARVRPGVLEALQKEVSRNCPTARVLFSFSGDLYCPGHTSASREALSIMRDAGAPFEVLTKGGARSVGDLDLYAGGLGRYAISLVHGTEESRLRWEPNAAPIAERIEALAEAHRLGIETWVSIEPVIDPKETAEALGILEDHDILHAIGHLKIGKLNHHPAENEVDWTEFADELAAWLPGWGIPYYIKESLRPYWPSGVPVNTLPDETRGGVCA
jgi:DNA repair photolyase